MSSHVTAPTQALTHPPIAPAWRPWSAAWTDLVKRLTPRHDLSVIVTPGAGHGAPAMFTVPDATIEVDATHIKIDPAVVDPADLTLRPLYATGWGLLVHEAAHATHTRWPNKVDEQAHDPQVLEAAMLLEEARCEHRQLQRRPRDQHWLHAAVTELILPGSTVQVSRTQAAMTAALVLGRVDGGVLTAEEAAEVRAAVRKALGGKLLRKLETIWRRALRTGDDDHPAMLEWGRRWVRALGRDPHLPLPGLSGDEIRHAIEGMLVAVLGQLAMDAIDALNELARRQRTGEKATEDAIRRAAKAAADAVFQRVAKLPTRPASDAERAASGRLTRALRAASLREPTVTPYTSAVPPGRLSVRAAMSSDVQRAMGQNPTAEPWRHKRRKANPRPPLRVGITIDVSGSMTHFLDPAASTTWIVAHATSRLPGSASAAITFGTRVRAISRPGQPTPAVPILPQEGATSGFVTAVDALDHALGLSQTGHSARLLVVISDGYLDWPDLLPGQGRIDRLLRTGCGLLWIAPEQCVPLRGGQTVIADDAATIGDLITSAAVEALRAR
ncbi:VWA domain-containing protein [Micromonospora sp. DT4]|uniref:VWA domain-containing protein n=1 Tax=Micromonospora sp. DT4 TaxID=3393438 RepID=UPI003CEADF63